MKKIEQDTLSRLKESYQGTDPLERAYQGTKSQAGETPQPPQVGSTTSVPATDESTPQNTPRDNE